MQFLLISTFLMTLISSLEATSRTLRFRHPFDRVEQCERPCQREPYWISFDAIMELANIPNTLRPILRPKQETNEHTFMFDVGRCSGFCKLNPFPLYHDFTVSFSLKWNKKLKIWIQNMETRCIPIEFIDLKTEITIAGEKIMGPTIQNLIIKNCACSEIQACSGWVTK